MIIYCMRNGILLHPIQQQSFIWTFSKFLSIIYERWHYLYPCQRVDKIVLSLKVLGKRKVDRVS